MIAYFSFDSVFPGRFLSLPFVSLNACTFANEGRGNNGNHCSIAPHAFGPLPTFLFLRLLSSLLSSSSFFIVSFFLLLKLFRHFFKFLSFCLPIHSSIRSNTTASLPFHNAHTQTQTHTHQLSRAIHECFVLSFFFCYSSLLFALFSFLLLRLYLTSFNHVGNYFAYPKP